MLSRSSLVQVRVEPWLDAVGVVLFEDAEGVTVRLGNGLTITTTAHDLAEVEYMPGTGTPATFPEEMQESKQRPVSKSSARNF